MNSALDTLAEAGILDDSRYARLWIEGRIKHKAVSPRQLLASLYGKGICRAVATAALKETLDSDSELALLRNFMAKSSPEGRGCGNSRERLRFEGFSAEVLERLDDDCNQEYGRSGGV